jgi:hypothetical protein
MAASTCMETQSSRLPVVGKDRCESRRWKALGVGSWEERGKEQLPNQLEWRGEGCKVIQEENDTVTQGETSC